jgi:hypothetical protein
MPSTVNSGMGTNDNAGRNRSLRSMGLYLVVAFVMAWVLWLVGWLITQHRLSLPLFPVLVVGSFGPFVGAVVVTWTEGGPRHAWRFLARAFELRMGWGVFLVSFFLLPILAVIVELVHAKFTHGAPHFTMTLSEAPLSYLFLFLIGGTLAEEYGWLLLSDKLDGVLPLKAATFVLGVIWAVWHVPLFFIVTPGAIQGYTPFYIFLTATVAMRFLFAWAYHRGGNNVLSNMLFHTASNMAYSIVALAPSPEDLSTGRLWMFAVLNIVSAAVLWNVAPPRRDPALIAPR